MKKETPLKNRPEIHLSVDSWEVVIYHSLPDLEEEKINTVLDPDIEILPFTGG